MIRHPLFVISFVLLLTVAVLHSIAIKYHFYWTLSWIDIPIHFLGGLTVSLAAIWFFYFSRYIPPLRLSALSIFIIAGTSVLVVGIIWESFELLAGIAERNADYYISDTVLDFVANITGAVFGSLLAIGLYNKKSS